jgi:hypothetical protein
MKIVLSCIADSNVIVGIDLLQNSLAMFIIKKIIHNLKNEIRAGGIAQVVQCLFTNHEALSSNPNTIKKEKKN